MLDECSRENETTSRTQSDEADDVSAAGFTFDLHAHPGEFFRRGLPGSDVDEAFKARVEDMAAGGMTSAFFALVADIAILEITDTGIRVSRLFEPGEAWDDYRRQLRQLRELIAVGSAREVRNLVEADAARAEGAVSAFVAVEGGDFLEGDIERLGRAYDEGVRSIQLVHYAQNNLGDLQTEPPVYDGLSPFGRDVVDGMVALGMVIDVAHASFTTVKDVADRAGVPIVLSHSLLNTPERPHPRHISADHARLIAETGGVIGLWPSGFGSETLDEFVDHTFRMIELVGLEHVGLGTDMDGNYRPVIASYQDYAAWVRALEARGLSKTEVARLTGGNVRQVLETVLKRGV